MGKGVSLVINALNTILYHFQGIFSTYISFSKAKKVYPAQILQAGNAEKLILFFHLGEDFSQSLMEGGAKIPQLPCHLGVFYSEFAAE
jgi:hypothetical protein